MLPTVIINNISFNNKTLISVRFSNSAMLNQLCADYRGLVFNKENNCWVTTDESVTLNTLFNLFNGKAWVNYDALKKQKPEEKKPKQKAVTNTFKNIVWPETHKKAMFDYADKLKLRRYSDNTFRIYGRYFKLFLSAHIHKLPEEITDEEIKAFLLDIVTTNDYASKTQNQIINAIKFYYEQVLGLNKKQYWIDRPRKESKLPLIISEEDVVRLLTAASNLKHKCMIAMLYSAGLRRSELLNMQITDVDINRMQVFVRNGKGKKDRVSLLSVRLALALENYYLQYKPKKWLFEGLHNKQYSGTSLSKLIQRACKNAGIHKKVTPHILRHSFSSQLFILKVFMNSFLFCHTFVR